ncbi:MAG: bifunctional hydroxymethylpyrimidine kinase/phosphomethylpyrimidine kinase [Merismopedia sp. SIO2A8]|nr:bifunctional hydroxymethylpyrimidine kinase/phosphomethylpyrimidine kinase [Merismopedia sp. SIO2A8]
MTTIPVALTIAGSDSGGGAGIQADLKTFAVHHVHGTSALTCVTAQNTVGVNRVDVLPPEAVTTQIAAVVDDIGIHSVKTGMLPNAAIITAVAQSLEPMALDRLVVDPVMVSRAGVQLIENDAIATLKQVLIPIATILTPNRYEAELLSGQAIQTLDDMKRAAQIILKLGPKMVVLKGGGMEGRERGVDVVCDHDRLDVLKTELVDTSDTHGTGCTLSAAIAANLARGQDPMDAIRHGKSYVTKALRHSLKIGMGQGPVGHFFPLLPNLGE